MMRVRRVLAGWGFDGVGVALSGLCLVHCLAPAVLSLAFSVTCADDHWHAVLAVVLPAVALFAFQRGYACHRAVGPLCGGVFGVCLVVMGVLAGEVIGERFEIALTVGGSLVLAVAHLANHRLLIANKVHLDMNCC